MNKYFIAILCISICACQQFEPQQLTAVPPGTHTVQYTDPEGNSRMIDSTSNTATTFSKGAIYATPPGAQYTLLFPDGSKVKLNAASTLLVKQFDQKKRIVRLVGEAFFEIATNSNVPFTVLTEDANITAHGTTFNIQVYPDEPLRSTTLIEGSLEISNSQKTVVLTPGQQVLLEKDLPLTAADVENDLAWKEGFYNVSDLEIMLRQVSRLNNVKLIINGCLPVKGFEGKMPASAKLNSIINILTANGLVMQYDKQQKTLSVGGTSN